ncbi:MAG: 3',5'-cyclic-AMP phosphodiesterase [Pseudohongiella sp.]|nr:3',5'-cyclic-AMP phosphodiesterase [Pseudohongiella sp.]
MTILTTQNPINIIQITDTHLYADPAGTLLKMTTSKSLSHVIDLIRAEETGIDLLLATGDLAQDASDAAYNNFLVATSQFDAPLRWIPGNHDDSAVMDRVAEGTDLGEKTVKINNWLIVMLDSTIPGQSYGNLSTSELAFLQARLQHAEEDNSIDHCLIGLHHNPVPASAAWMKDVGLQNGAEFFAAVKTFSKLKCVLYGHIHHELDFKHQGIRCLCSPSTCIQFKPNVSNFTLDRVNPGYRYLRLLDDGHIESAIVRVSGDVFEADYSSSGY